MLLFNGVTRRMFDVDSSLDEAVPATADSKRRLREWLFKVIPNGGTDPREALRIGLGLRPSALFLLSDGEFNLDDKTPHRRLRHGNSKPGDMIAKRGHGKIPIHTFAYESQSAVATMQTLSRETGGQYRFVATTPQTAKPFALGQRTVHASQPPNGVSADIASQSLLALAESLESRGDAQGALAEYQRIIDDFPQTEAARQAKVHKSLLSLLLSP